MTATKAGERKAIAAVGPIVAGALLAALLTGSGGPTSPCGGQAEQAYARKAELPRGAAEAAGFAMAEKGAVYQRGDIMQKGVPLYRFVHATRVGCRITISYEGGGFVRQWGTITLDWSKGRWRVVGEA